MFISLKSLVLLKFKTSFYSEPTYFLHTFTSLISYSYVYVTKILLLRDHRRPDCVGCYEDLHSDDITQVSIISAPITCFRYSFVLVNTQIEFISRTHRIEV